MAKVVKATKPKPKDEYKMMTKSRNHRDKLFKIVAKSYVFGGGYDETLIISSSKAAINECIICLSQSNIMNCPCCEIRSCEKCIKDDKCSLCRNSHNHWEWCSICDETWICSKNNKVQLQLCNQQKCNLIDKKRVCDKCYEKKK